MEIENKKFFKIIVGSLFVLVLSLVLYDIFFGKMGFFEYLSMRGKHEMLEKKRKQVVEEIGEMEREGNNLRENLNYIEDIARDELGLLKEREKIIILEDDEVNSNAVSSGDDS